MTFTSDIQERAMIEAAIREARVQRAHYFAKAIRSFKQWLTQSIDPMKVQLTRANMGGIGHTSKLEPMS
ncbi:MAG: hypothetical protein JKY27_00275 [Magnetovibrio sp.]|nr:hypothetical protein [Magnetovibrio sp.]